MFCLCAVSLCVVVLCTTWYACLCFVVVFFVCCVLCGVVIITAGGVGEATPAGGRVAKDDKEREPAQKYTTYGTRISTHTSGPKNIPPTILVYPYTNRQATLSPRKYYTK